MARPFNGWGLGLEYHRHVGTGGVRTSRARLWQETRMSQPACSTAEVALGRGAV